MGQVNLESIKSNDDIMALINNIRFASNGLIPCIAVDYQTKVVLMQAYMNKESLVKTLQTGTITYFSRSRKALWTKGETSGNFQKLKSLFIDCDHDSILVEVNQVGVACHTGSKSCFYEDQVLFGFPSEVFSKLKRTIYDRKVNPEIGSYTNYLLEKGVDKILKKVGEETAEVIIASKNNKKEVVYETADLLYHLLVLYESLEIDFNEVFAELSVRASAP